MIFQVAAEIFGVKTNFEFEFPARPTLLEITRLVESAFSSEIAQKRSEGVPQHSFHVSKFKLYDEGRAKWVDLISETQLFPDCQLYAFQPENMWHKESQKEIPQARRPPQGTLSATRPASIVPTVQPTQPRVFNGNVSDEEKLRIVFAEFDMKGHRMIDMEDLKQGFRTLGLEFTTATMNDLFQKGDLNSDGRISFSEFERFAKLFPIMTDCLFFRSKAFWDEENMNREIQSEKEAVRQAQTVVQQVVNQHAQAQKAVEEATEQVGATEQELKERNERIRDIAQQGDQLQREKDRCQKEKFEKENELVSQRDKERQARQNQSDIAREVEKAERRCGGLSTEAQKADDRVKILQQQLAEAQRGFDRAQSALKQGQSELDTVKQREKEAFKQADTISREVPRIEELYRQAEQGFTGVCDRLRELEGLNRDLQRENDEAARKRDAHERAAGAARDQQTELQQELEKAKRSAEERERQAKQREAELLEQQRQRQLVTQHERALIEQELRLREQRDTLEEKETKLKTDASSFLANLRSSMQRNSYSRDPSTSSFLGEGTQYQRGASGY